MLPRTFTLLLLTGLTLWPAQTVMAAPPVDPCGGTETMCGDGGPATAAFMLRPEGLAVDARAGVLVADTGNDAIRRVGPAGTIAAVAGLGTPGVAGDRGPAVAAQLNLPTDVAAVP